VIGQELRLRDTFGTGSPTERAGIDTPGPDLA
jgi:2-aminoadipate transaminase